MYCIVLSAGGGAEVRRYGLYVMGRNVVYGGHIMTNIHIYIYILYHRLHHQYISVHYVS